MVRIPNEAYEAAEISHRLQHGGDKPRSFGGTIGGREAELTDALVDELDMRAALTRFANALLQQYPAKRITAVKIESITFNFETDGSLR